MRPPLPLPRLIGISLLLTVLIFLAISQHETSTYHQAIHTASKWAQRITSPSSSSSSLEPTAEECASLPPLQFHPNPAYRTILASYPRAGNSMLRSLVQESTGYISGSRYCDFELSEVLIGECNATDKFFYKSHFPSGHLYGVQMRENPNYWKSFDQVVYLERNPFDSLYSDWHRVHTGGSMTEQAKIVGLLGDDVKDEITISSMMRTYNAHHEYWHSVPLPRLVVQYEEMRRPSRLRLLLHQLSGFLLGDDEPVDQLRIACAAREDSSTEVYKSRKHKTFHSWDKWNPVLRGKVLVALLPTLCRSGYFVKLQRAFPDDPALQSLSCPTIDTTRVSRIISETSRDFDGSLPQIPHNISTSTIPAPDFNRLETYCPSYTPPGTREKEVEEAWQRGVLERKACKAEDQPSVNRLFESSIRQCFSWCIYNLGTQTGALDTGEGRSMTRLIESLDDGKREGWTLKGKCWAPFYAGEATCSREWVWIKNRLGLQ
ncbi:hypothetical protein T439DRAFT_322476 [Meredithblackwellia eburnea MCA 4105]